MRVLWQDLCFGARMLINKPGFTLIAILTLALGIGANTAIFTIVNAVLLRPLPYPESERLMEIGRAFGYPYVDALSEPKFVFLRDNANSFEGITAIQGAGSLYLSDESQAEYVNGLRVTADFFRVLEVAPARGRAFTAAEDSPGGERVAILSDGFWRRRFGKDEAVVGKSIELNGVRHEIIGVMPASMEYAGYYAGAHEVLLPMRVNPASQNEGHNWEVVGRLRSGVTVDQARAEAENLFKNFSAAYPKQVQRNETFGVQNWRSNITGGVRELLWILLGAVTFVLLIACANVANLQLVRAASRQKEMAIRRALGASAWRLVLQLLTEGLLLALLGGAAGLLLTFWGLDAMLGLVPEGMIPRAAEIGTDWHVLLFALVTSLVTGILFGLAPALQTARIDINNVLKDGGGEPGSRFVRGWLARWLSGSRRGRLRTAIVVVLEVALAVALTVGAGLLLRTFANLRNVEMGFDARQILSFSISPRGRNYESVTSINELYRRGLEELRRLPGVESVALTNQLPLDSKFNLPFRLAGQSEWSGSAEYRIISPDYFNTMKMVVRRGRTFNKDDKAGTEPVIIINEALARRSLRGADSIGRQLCAGCEYGDPSQRQVVGVVNDTKQRSLIDSAPPTVFIPLSQAPASMSDLLRGSSFVIRTTGDPMRLAGTIRETIHRLDPALPVRNSAITGTDRRPFGRAAAFQPLAADTLRLARPHAGGHRDLRSSGLQRLTTDARDRTPNGARCAAA